jgi:hypothetical protein
LNWKLNIILFFLGIGVVAFLSKWETSPGYMDAEYYYATGQQLVEAGGFVESFLWNYLDDPQGLPHPSHAYWMPLASLVAAAGMYLTNSPTLTMARLGFLILAGLIPPLTASIVYSLNQRRSAAILAGILAVFSAFYLPFLPTTDTFVLYMLLGGGFFLILLQKNRGNAHFLGLGLAAGLMHLARADGFLWLFIALFATLYTNQTPTKFKSHALRLVIVITGYLLIMTPWFVRNQATFGTLLSPGGLTSLLFIDYDDLYTYPASTLTASRWWAVGISEILRVRLWALGQNLQSFIAVQGAIFLSPLIILGGWHLRKDRTVQVGVIAWIMTLGVMTVFFPFAGARGGYFHSGAALQPLFWALAVVGLDVFLAWGRRVRGWNIHQARNFFGFALVGMALALSVFIVNQRLLGSGTWNAGYEKYTLLEEKLLSVNASLDDEVLVNNPPGYYLASGRISLAIPDGNPQVLLDVAHRYQVEYVILESDHPQGLIELYLEPEANPEFILLWSDDNTHIFRVLELSESIDDT